MTNNYRKIRADELHYLPASTLHPANTYFHFSFANYYNPNNMNFGVLRVLNDDDVKPVSGFDKHPHNNMEIVSYVIKGKLTHWDSATNVKDTLERGHVQTVTAGKGVIHSELNEFNDWTRFLQIWILPPSNGLPVRYENFKYAPEDRENKLLQIVGNPANQNEVPLHLNQDINMFVSELTNTTTTVSYHLQSGRQAYINNFEGNVNIKGIEHLKERESLEITGPADLEFLATANNAHFIIIEMEQK